MNPFKSLRVFDENGKVTPRVVEVRLDELSSGEVVFQTAYSSVNYKDALAATGAGKIIRSFPRIAGIDATGTVISSADARFKAGDEVICTSYELGVGHDGGFSQVCGGSPDWEGALA